MLESTTTESFFSGHTLSAAAVVASSLVTRSLYQGIISRSGLNSLRSGKFELVRG